MAFYQPRHSHPPRTERHGVDEVNAQVVHGGPSPHDVSTSRHGVEGRRPSMSNASTASQSSAPKVGGSTAARLAQEAADWSVIFPGRSTSPPTFPLPAHDGTGRFRSTGGSPHSDDGDDIYAASTFSTDGYELEGSPSLPDVGEWTSAAGSEFDFDDEVEEELDGSGSSSREELGSVRHSRRWERAVAARRPSTTSSTLLRSPPSGPLSAASGISEFGEPLSPTTSFNFTSSDGEEERLVRDGAATPRRSRDAEEVEALLGFTPQAESAGMDNALTSSSRLPASSVAPRKRRHRTQGRASSEASKRSNTCLSAGSSMASMEKGGHLTNSATRVSQGRSGSRSQTVSIRSSNGRLPSATRRLPPRPPVIAPATAAVRQARANREREGFFLGSIVRRFMNLDEETVDMFLNEGDTSTLWSGSGDRTPTPATTSRSSRWESGVDQFASALRKHVQFAQRENGDMSVWDPYESELASSKNATPATSHSGWSGVDVIHPVLALAQAADPPSMSVPVPAFDLHLILSFVSPPYLALLPLALFPSKSVNLLAQMVGALSPHSSSSGEDGDEDIDRTKTKANVRRKDVNIFASIVDDDGHDLTVAGDQYGQVANITADEEVSDLELGPPTLAAQSFLVFDERRSQNRGSLSSSAPAQRPLSRDSGSGRSFVGGRAPASALKGGDDRDRRRSGDEEHMGDIVSIALWEVVWERWRSVRHMFIGF